MLVLWLVGLVIHGLWALTVPSPVDWDSAYYRLVAQQIVGGEGATLPSVWTLVLLPESLPMPADLHWMPLPSRVLLPGLAVWADHGDQLVTISLAALWGPLAWRLARGAVDDGRVAWLAGGLACLGGGYARFLSTPDSIALFGVLGGVGWLTVQRGQVLGCAAVAVAAALTRGDGFLLGLALGVGLWLGGARTARGAGGALAVALAGLAAWGLWSARGVWLMGDAAMASRAATAHALDMADFLRGQVAPIGVSARLAHLLVELDDAVRTVLIAGAATLPPVALLGLWRGRRRSEVMALAAFAFLVLTVPLLAAPAIASSGTLFRSGAAVFVGACVLGAEATVWLGDQGTARRGYPRLLIVALVGLGFATTSVGVGLGTWRARPAAPVDCDRVVDLPAGTVVLTGEPLFVSERCGVETVVAPAGLDAATLSILEARYDLGLAIPATPGGLGATAEELAALLPDWHQAADGTLRPP